MQVYRRPLKTVIERMLTRWDYYMQNPLAAFLLPLSALEFFIIIVLIFR